MACRFDDKTTIKTNTKEKDGDITEDPVIHYVPFKVEYDGPANVKDKFTDLVKPSSFVLSGDRQERVFTNRFRGRPLDGKRIELPENFVGVVLVDSKPESGKEGTRDQNERVVSVSSTFKSITYWNWDKDPSVMDSPVKLNDWLELSSVLHEPVTK